MLRFMPLGVFAVLFVVTAGENARAQTRPPSEPSSAARRFSPYTSPAVAAQRAQEAAAARQRTVYDDLARPWYAEPYRPGRYHGYPSYYRGGVHSYYGLPYAHRYGLYRSWYDRYGVGYPDRYQAYNPPRPEQYLGPSRRIDAAPTEPRDEAWYYW